jgi:uncharacterized protein involved in exopolysaccharide biosynthesis
VDLGAVLKRQIVPVSFITLIGLFSALCFSIYLPRQFEATAKIMVERALPTSLLRAGADNGLSNARVDSEVEIFKADPVYLTTIRKLGLAHRDLESENAWWRRFILLPSPTETERYLVALDELKRKTHIRRIGTTQIINVIVRDDDRKQAAFLANNLAQNFVEFRQENQIEAAIAHRKRLDLLAQNARAELSKAEKELAQFSISTSAIGPKSVVEKYRLEAQQKAAQLHYETALAEQRAAAVDTLFPAVNVKLVANATQPIHPTYPNVRVLGLALFFAFLLLAGWVAVHRDQNEMHLWDEEKA